MRRKSWLNSIGLDKWRQKKRRASRLRWNNRSRGTWEATLLLPAVTFNVALGCHSGSKSRASSAEGPEKMLRR